MTAATGVRTAATTEATGAMTAATGVPDRGCCGDSSTRDERVILLTGGLLLSLTASMNPPLVAATTVMLLLDNPAKLMLGYLLGAYGFNLVMLWLLEAPLLSFVIAPSGPLARSSGPRPGSPGTRTCSP